MMLRSIEADNSHLDELSLPNPTRRNGLWLLCQFVLRLVFALGLRFRARGQEHIPKTGGGLLLMNHQSSLDPLLTGLPLRRPISYVARHSLFSRPVIGWILRRTYVLPINRESASSRVIKAMVQRMEHGFLAGMFPEGTRSAEGNVGAFKPGFIALIRRCPVPIYPVGIAGADHAMPKGVLLPRCGRVRVVYGEPISPEEYQPYLEHGREEELLTLVRERVVQCQHAAQTWRQDSRFANRRDDLSPQQPASQEQAEPSRRNPEDITR